MKKIPVSALALLMLSVNCALLFGADVTKAAPGQAARRPNFSIISGDITKIDNSDPAKPALEIKNSADGTTHKVDITPWTSVTKVTDLTELKTGDTVRIMARKVEDSEVAMTVVFGKIKNLYAPRTARPAVTQAPAAAAQGAVKK